LTPLNPPSPVLSFSHAAPPTEIYTLSLHDALPISSWAPLSSRGRFREAAAKPGGTAIPVAPAPIEGAFEVFQVRASGPLRRPGRDRKSTRLNSSHVKISYAVFCLKKKKDSTAT